MPKQQVTRQWVSLDTNDTASNGKALCKHCGFMVAVCQKQDIKLHLHVVKYRVKQNKKQYLHIVKYFEERERHSTANNHLVHFVQQVLNEQNLVCHLCTVMHKHRPQFSHS